MTVTSDITGDIDTENGDLVSDNAATIQDNVQTNKITMEKGSMIEGTIVGIISAPSGGNLGVEGKIDGSVVGFGSPSRRDHTYINPVRFDI